MIHRKIIIVLIAIVFLTPCIMAGTSKFKDILETPAMKSPLAEKAPINALAAAGKRLVAVGQRGHILYSDDNGTTWTQAPSPVSSDLTAVTFPSVRMGWAVGHDGVVLHTADSGATWVKQFDGNTASRVIQHYYSQLSPADINMETIKRLVREGAEKSFLDVWFDNEKDGFIVGAFNLIFRTADGGKTWEPWLDRTENPGSLHLYAVKRIGTDMFISGEQGTILKLDPAAKRFYKLDTPYLGTYFGITGRSGALIAFGMRGNVFRSADGGKNWQKVETGLQTGLTGAAVTGNGHIVLVSLGGEIILSADNGTSFKPVEAEQALPLAAVIATDKNTLVLAGLYGIHVQNITK